jgi:hypothetical protein
LSVGCIFDDALFYFSEGSPRPSVSDRAPDDYLNPVVSSTETATPARRVFGEGSRPIVFENEVGGDTRGGWAFRFKRKKGARVVFHCEQPMDPPMPSESGTGSDYLHPVASHRERHIGRNDASQSGVLENSGAQRTDVPAALSETGSDNLHPVSSQREWHLFRKGASKSAAEKSDARNCPERAGFGHNDVSTAPRNHAAQGWRGHEILGKCTPTEGIHCKQPGASSENEANTFPHVISCLSSSLAHAVGSLFHITSAQPLQSFRSSRTANQSAVHFTLSAVSGTHSSPDANSSQGTHFPASTHSSPDTENSPDVAATTAPEHCRLSSISTDSDGYLRPRPSATLRGEPRHESHSVPRFKPATDHTSRHPRKGPAPTHKPTPPDRNKKPVKAHRL